MSGNRSLVRAAVHALTRRQLSPAGALLLAFAASACAPATSPEDEEPPLDYKDAPGSLVKDTFTRTASNGWGIADIGGRWRIDSVDIGSFRVDGIHGLIVARRTHPVNVVATAGYGLNVAGLVSFSIDRMPDNPARFHAVQVYARRDDRASDGDNYYRFRVRAFGTGKMDVRIEKNVRMAPAWIAEAVTVPAVWKPGQRYWVRWECVGTSPATTVQIRVWADGAEEPSAWQSTITIDEPALDVAGTTGIRVEGPDADQVNFPITFSFDDLEYSVRR